MREYTTQMDAACKGILTPQMEEVLRNESISKQDLMEIMSQGRIV
ncbi:MAG: thiamine biosynthesis protein ThiC, partial [Candidatus Electrothrix sp. AR1]|nr:thiamine biosynthesis protein ThiC [Candidatus Electrothrix sp. AR1]